MTKEKEWKMKSNRPRQIYHAAEAEADLAWKECQINIFK